MGIKRKKIKKSKLAKPTELPIYRAHKPLCASVYKARIKVIGIGGGGNSIVSEIASEVKKVNFVAVNADQQALRKVPQKIKRFQIGQKITGGLGTGMNPELGEIAAQEERERIKELLKGTDFCILVSSLGGGIGSGASPVFADISRRLRIKTLGIFTLPFDFEGREKMEVAKASLEKLAPNLNALVIIPNQKIFQVVEKNTPLKEALSTVNKFLAQSLGGLIEMIYSSGLIKVGLADLKSILEGRKKLAFLNTSEAKGSNQVEEIAKNVLSNPLYPYSPKEATGILFSVAGGLNLSMGQVEQIGKTISEATNSKAKIAFGITQDKEKKIKITLLANGCKWKEWAGEKEKPKKKVKTAKKTPELSEGPQSEILQGSVEEKPEEVAKPKRPSRKPRLKRKIKVKTIRTPLDLSEINQKEEKKMLSQEKKWETPAFLRRSSSQTDEEAEGKF